MRRDNQGPGCRGKVLSSDSYKSKSQRQVSEAGSWSPVCPWVGDEAPGTAMPVWVWEPRNGIQGVSSSC